MKISEWLKEKKWRNIRKDQWAIVLLTGVLLLVIAIPVSDTDNAGESTDILNGEDLPDEENGKIKAAAESTGTFYAEEMEERLENALSRMEGVGEVEVLITLKDEGESVVEKDVEEEHGITLESGDGTSRSTNSDSYREETVYDSGEEPLISNELAPRAEGVLVICTGAENTKVKQDIMEAVMALFQVESHKIKVVKMNSEE